MEVGARVDVEGRGVGMLALDNEDGTWNVEFDDGSEGDVLTSDLKLCEQFWKPDSSLKDANALLLARHAKDHRALMAKTDERTRGLLQQALASGSRTGHMSEIRPRLWLGDAWAASQLEALEERGVVAVVNCAVELPNHHPEALRYLKIEVSDSEAAGPALAAHFDVACDFIDEALSNPGGSVLVHCAAGRSRSATIIIVFMMRRLGFTLRDAIAACMERRWVTPNQGFMQQLAMEEARINTTRAEAEASHEPRPLQPAQNVGYYPGPLAP